MDSPSRLLLAYVGDDFTGSTDALEFLGRAGLKAALFLEPPSPATLRRYEGLQAIGVAGLTRSLPPGPMEAALRPVFLALAALGPAHVHYKVCSTFDSSPAVGSIGRAIEVGREVFHSQFVPLLVAAPALGRYCLFGHLFARMGIGSTGEIYRLDRHPSMSRHPVTPSDESDLRLHLGRQTALRIGLVDLLAVAGAVDQVRAQRDAVVAAGADVVLFDALDAGHLARIGAVLDGDSEGGATRFLVGSSGVEMALGEAWTSAGICRPVHQWPGPGACQPLLVVSGSCSPVTAGQIDRALAAGFAGVAMDAVAAAEGREEANEAQAMLAALRQGQSVVVHTSRGEVARGFGAAESARLGTRLGRLARMAVESAGVRRVLLAGGDSSSHAARALGLESMEMIAPLAPGAPLCLARAPGSPVDGLEVNFKGGQVGAADYFDAVRRGKL